MKATVFSSYGPPDVLRIEEVPTPVPRKTDILVQVHATTVTAGDWRMRKADPFYARIFSGLFRPKRVTILGFEFSGVVSGVGEKVTRFKLGDEVFGSPGFRFGAYAQFLTIAENGIVTTKPMNLSFEESAAVPIGGLGAFRALRQGRIASGMKVLINGSSGSVGTFAVQIAKHLGAHVTGVCSGRNTDLVRSLGADEVRDYTTEDVTAGSERYDLVFDAVGKLMSGKTASDFKRILNPGGMFTSIESSEKDRAEDLVSLKEMIEAGALRPVIDRTYEFEEVPEAHAYVESGRKRGNVVVRIPEPDNDSK